MNECASALSSSCIVLCANIFVVVIMITIIIMIITTIIVIITTLRSVFHHLLSPQSNGLFRAGLANSGTMISGLADRSLSACRHDRQVSVSIFISIVIIIGYLSSHYNYKNHRLEDIEIIKPFFTHLGDGGIPRQPKGNCRYHNA